MNLDFHFEEATNTYFIDSINGLKNWWYIAHYHGGWREGNMFRMDHYPYKDKMWINILRVGSPTIEEIREAFIKDQRTQ